MRKCLSIFLIFVLLLGLLSACSSPNPLADLMHQLSEMEGTVFTAVGEVTFADGIPVSHGLPHRYEIQGTRTAAGDLSAMIAYADAEGDSIVDIPLIHTDSANYIGFIPLFQRIMDQTYAPYTILPLRDTFAIGPPESTDPPYLTDPALRLENLPIDFPALISSLDNRYVQEALTYYTGHYSLSLSGDQLSPHVLAVVAAPFALYSDLLAHVDEDARSDSVFTSLLSGNISTYTLELMFMMDEEASEFTMWLTLYAPELMTITADVIYQERPPISLAPPDLVFDVETLHTFLTYYRDAQALLVLLERHGLEVIPDLPELHMTMHEATDLLVPFDMEIGEEIYSVSVMVGASNTSANGFVHSFTPAMSLLYTTLDTSSASATMAPFVLEDLGLDAYDAENFERTAMRVNAHDTAAVKALYFDDNLVGRTLHIYVLQNLDESDCAIFLAVTIMIDHFTAHAYAVLEELGFLIGINLLEYVELAQS